MPSLLQLGLQLLTVTSVLVDKRLSFLLELLDATGRDAVLVFKRLGASVVLEGVFFETLGLEDGQFKGFALLCEKGEERLELGHIVLLLFEGAFYTLAHEVMPLLKLG